MDRGTETEKEMERDAEPDKETNAGPLVDQERQIGEALIT